jgi:hypothetical protein
MHPGYVKGNSDRLGITAFCTSINPIVAVIGRVEAGWGADDGKGDGIGSDRDYNPFPLIPW